MSNFYITRFREYIFIILTATIFSIISFSKSFSEENVFVIDGVKIVGLMEINHSRDKYINKAFLSSFEILKSKILLSRDLNKINNVKLNTIKSMIDSFQISEEIYEKDEYQVTFKIFYNDNKVQKFLGQKNISFSYPKNISVIFFPTLFINDEMKNFDENYFYKKWNTIKIKNETINFILPLEDLDDISKIKNMKNSIEELNVSDFVSKYDIANYVFALMDHSNKKLNVHLKTNFNNNNVSKNILYELDNIENEIKLNFILKDLKTQTEDLWKEVNIVNLSMPLTIRIKFKHKNLIDLDELRSAFYKISIINNYFLEEFNINNSMFKIYYYGNPKRLKTELLKFGYKLKNDQGYWELYIDG